ncbi:hypothetical protein G6F22_003661 [Rhizopus arrhizus]|nr:hypothetical protein G6F22_003661 [Rhizopus arrhizus]KAG1225074.1 hypothetical protein G6F35_003621 [Rhizopus arrhizus]
MPSSPSSTDSPDRPAKRQKTRSSTSMTQEFLGIMNSVFKIQLANEKNEKENTQNSAQPTVLDPDNTAEKEQNHELQEAAFSAEPASNNSHDQFLVAISEDADKTVNTAEDIPNLSSWEPSSEETAQLQKLIFNSDSPPITSSNALHENAELHPFTENIPKDNHIITEDSLEMPESLASSMFLEDNSALSSNLCTDIIEPSQPLNILIQENDSQVLSDNTTGDIEESREEDFEIWWYDVYEQRSKGYIYLFGKQYEESVNDYVSCCVLVKNIQREIYILPRKFKLSDQGEETSETIDMSDVRKEIQELFLSKNIKSWNAEICTRKYTFGLANVPFETEYLKINYSYKDPELPSDLSGKTFLYIFGLNTTPLERFIIQNDIMGPGWIAFKNATLTDNNQSWSKINAVVNDPSFCRVIKKSEKDPQMKILSIKCQTAVNKTTKRNEIITVSGVLANKVSLDDQISVESLDLSRFSAIRLLPGTIYPEGIEELVDKERKEKAHEIRLELTEYALLSYVTAKIHHIDPDIIIGHNIWNTDLNILLNSMKRSNTSYWHKLGRLRPKHWPRMNTDNTGMVTREMRLIMSGRLVCDTFIASQELIQSKTYDLSELAMSLLDIERYEVDLHHPTKHYQNSLDIMNLVYHGSFDAYLVLSIAFKLQILSLSKQLTKLAGNLWSTSINGGARTDRNDYLLLHAFYKNQFICPDKRDRRVNNKQDSTEEDIIKQNESSFSGGLVLEPKPGLYKRYVLLLDFNSLYPSIIQEYNVCHTTMNLQKIGANETSMDMIAQEMLSESQRIGILPKLVRKFVQRRQQVKKAMKDPTIGDSQKNQFDIEQKALKGTANSMYGCLGSPFSRFYARPLAIFITSKGREILRNAVDSAEELHLDVIYGDTDSIMINTGESNLSKANQLGLSFKEKVNKNYNHLEIDVDGCFKRALLLKKKRYAMVQVTEKTDGVGLVETIESKGLDLNRRDFCCLSRNLSQ